ncbi:MAG: malto-oligosyltrehalose synthase [Janthinobacterium lividum]
MTLPLATLRLQFHKDFTFDDALRHVDYFAGLGVSHLYASPITTAQPGSTHGYDTVDYTRINPELGGEVAFDRLVDALRARGMGLVIDIVPNHMGVGGGHNAWWLDLLEYGPTATHAQFFDADWEAADPTLHGRLLAPFLGEPYGDALEAGKLSLQYDATYRRFFVAYYAHVLPVRREDYAGILALDKPADGDPLDGCSDAQIDAALERFAPDGPAGRERLHALLERQHYRLAWWRTASDEINWRRFFDISALAGMRQEDPVVFDASHALVLRLYEAGRIDGVRIDHVDGMAEPREYCQRLRAKLEAAHAKRPEALRAGKPWIVIEKILARGEAMRLDWQVDGTTGYDFLNDAGALLHDPAGAAPLAAAWHALSGRPADFADEALVARRKMLAENLAAELDRCARSLHRLARAGLATRDISFIAIRRVLIELLVHYPVYRIYPQAGRRSVEDERYFAVARDGARRTLRRADWSLLEQLDAWLGGADLPAVPDDTAAPPSADAPGPDQLDAWRRGALALFSQLSSPTAAKSVEDTACYRYGRLISRNEVGADPGDFSLSVADFHALNRQRAQDFPHALLATATHDHKRGEDVRARLAVLSEMPEEWIATARRWSQLNLPQRRALEDLTSEGAQTWAPGAAAENMLYQTLVGCWPLGLQADDAEGIHALAERVAQWQEKALREAKLDTDWFAPNEAYEHGSREFLFDILSPQRRDGFIASLVEFVERIAPAGVINSLQQTLLRLTCPGIPDLYQGTEWWDWSLVDPDNRRAVDYDARQQALQDLGNAKAAELLNTWRDGRLKMAVVQRALALRRRLPELFSDGEYLPLEVEGAHANSVIAFARRLEDAWVLVVATRLAAPLLDDDPTASPEDHAIARSHTHTSSPLPYVPAPHWQDTRILLPTALGNRVWLDQLNGHTCRGTNGALPVTDVLHSWPVALLLLES